ncbi:MAG: phosphodiester glycosidase family protein [Oscillospiraceae bacterium]|nr:phosphodiester glycosidase family protein [Oscillospiraceae bacterium]
MAGGGAKKLKKRIVIIVIAMFSLPLFVMYGPFDQFRVLWINTAMTTANHKYLATALFTGKYIEKVMEQSRVRTDERTSDGKINIVSDDRVGFTEVKGSYYKGYIIKIADPSRVGLVCAAESGGEILEDIISSKGASGGINAGGYSDEKARGVPCGVVIFEGNTVNACKGKRHMLGGMDESGKFIVGTFDDAEIAEKNFKWALEFGPILIVNGKKTDITNFSGGLAPRTAIGQTGAGEILLLVVDGRQKSSIGATYADIQKILHSNGAENAIALDGGSSASIVYENILMNSPSDGDSERRLPNAIIFK